MYESESFIELLTGDPSTPVHWQIYHDSDKSKNETLARSFHCDYHNAAPYLHQAQQDGCGVYITVNQTDGARRKIENVTLARALFIDGDDIPLPDQNGWGCYPHIVVARNPRQWHAYWLIDPSTDFEEWQKLQYSLSLYYGVKDRLADLPRVMRAPGFWWLKDPAKPEEYKITYKNTNPRYSMKEVGQWHLLNPQKKQELDSWLTRPKLNKSGDDVISDTQVSIERFQIRMSGTTPETGDYNNTLFRVAGVGKDLGLSPEICKEQIGLWWASSWEITVEHDAISQVVDNAYKYGSNSIGNETSAAKFKNAPPLPQQVGSEEDLRVVVDGVAMSDVKYGKNHTVNAKVFISSHQAENIHYITIAQESYVYVGTHWRKLEPKELEQHVLLAMVDSRPNNDTVNCTAKLIQLLTADNTVKKTPSWISGVGRNPKNFIAFKNGILDVTDDMWIEHSHDLFYTHCLDYNYDPRATSHGWEAYLRNEVFNGDMEVISVLQEWMGYMLVNSYDYHKIALLIGAPSAGKGTVAGMMRRIIGSENVAAPTLSGLAKDSILNLISKKSVAIIGDAHKVSINLREIVLENLKMISGGDPITYDRKHIAGNTTKFPTRFTILCNEMPEFIDASGALAGRLIPIVFRNSYLGREDPKRLEKLLSEAPGVLNWSLAGLRRLQAQGKFTESKDGVEMLATLRDDLNPVASFISDCVEITCKEVDFVRVTDVYNVYKRWCKINERRHMPSPKFKKTLLSTNYQIHHRRRKIGNQTPHAFIGMVITNQLDNVVPGVFPPLPAGVKQI